MTCRCSNSILFVCANFYLRDPSALRDDESLLDSGIIDSTGVVEIAGFLHKAFGIEVEALKIHPANLDSVARIVQFVARKTGTTAPPDRDDSLASEDGRATTHLIDIK